MAKPMKALPMKGMPMGKRPPPPPFPVAHPQMQAQAQMAPNAPPAFASGTSNVNTNSQGMQTRPGMGGSWNPNDTMAPPPPPAPTPTGQNQGLRQSLGLGVKRFASGTSDVSGGGSEFGKAKDIPPEPTPGYDPQTGSYPGLDQHFVAHLRAAIGLAPKEQGFAGGTPNVGPAPFQSGPLLPPGFDLSGAPTWTNKPPDLPGPNYGGQPGGTVMDNPNDFTTRADAQQIYAGAGPNPQGQPGGSVPSRAALGGGFQRAASQDPLFGSVLQALTSQPPSTTENGKQIQDAHLNDAVSKSTGATSGQAEAFLQPHLHTRDEFIKAVSGMPWGMAKSLWAMQHYLTPQQQSAQQYLSNQTDATSLAKQALAGTQQGSKAEYDKNAAALQEQLKAQNETGRATLVGAQYPLIQDGQ